MHRDSSALPANNFIQPEGLLLVLDDEAAVAQSIVSMATRCGFRAVATYDAPSFFEALKQHQPTHIVLDLRMPNTDGILVLERLRAEACTANIIISSGVDQRVIDASARSASESGLHVSGAVSKPFTARTLQAALAQKTRSVGADTPTQRRPDVGAIKPEDIKAALDADIIRPHFQPKVNCRDGQLVGFEALARWEGQNTVSPTPDDFIPVTESSGQIGRLTERITGHAIRWLADSFPNSNNSIAFNVSAYSLGDSRVLDLIEALCDRFGINHERVVIEITESGMLGQDTEILNLLTRMRLKNFQLSIDDFGAGYSTIVQLSRLPFSELKIDKRFVTSVCNSAESRTIVNAIIGMAQGLNLATVAEGVEDLNTFNYLRDQGCDVAQGYFIGRPMSASDAMNWATDKQIGYAQIESGSSNQVCSRPPSASRTIRANSLLP